MQEEDVANVESEESLNYKESMAVDLRIFSFVIIVFVLNCLFGLYIRLKY
jgi:hypothetical protein